MKENTMNSLSPSAQAVFDAFCCEARPEPHHQREAIAAALRAIAERTEYKANSRDAMEVMFSEGWNGLRKEILDIAAELEAAD